MLAEFTGTNVTQLKQDKQVTVGGGLMYTFSSF